MNELKWISVKDRLPENNKLIAVVVRPYVMGDIESRCYLARYTGTFWMGTNGWLIEVSHNCKEMHGDEVAQFYNNIVARITHWMPLPELPEIE